MSDNDRNDALEAEQAAVDRLRQANTPENRDAFQDAHRRVADIELDNTRRRLHDHYRQRAREADSPQVDIENPTDYSNDILKGNG